MKKLITMLLLTIVALGFFFSVENGILSLSQDEMSSNPYHEYYYYEVTDITDDSIYAKPLNNFSDDNRQLYLVKYDFAELKIGVNGSVLEVIFDEDGDIMSVNKLEEVVEDGE